MEIDKQKVRKRFESGLATYNQQAEVQYNVANKLMDYLKKTETKPDSVLEIGCGTGFLTREVLKYYKPEQYTVNDISPGVDPFIKHLFSNSATHYEAIYGDIEKVGLPAKHSIIVSSSVLQWVADLKALARKLYLNLEENGILAFATYGPENFKELLALNVGLPYLSKATIKAILLSVGYDVEVAEQEKITMSFASPKALLVHIKDTGTTATEDGSAAAIRHYLKGKGTRCLTYHPVYIVARKSKV